MLLFIQTVCKDGFYGVNCSKKCGQCDDNYICDKGTGYCLMGCKTNLQPPFCKGKLFYLCGAVDIRAKTFFLLNC